jgi:hypothetical protein
MADQIPGRRITGGESFYTDWMSRGGDSMLLRVEALKTVGSPATVDFVVETRDQPGGTITSPVSPTVPSPGPLSLSSAIVATGYYKENLKAEVRLKISCTTSSSTYAVVRVFAPVFFDAAS